VRLLGDAPAAPVAVMNNKAATAYATWLQRHLGAAVFPVDHPGLPECAGWHKPAFPCDGKRGKHPACSWARDSTTDQKAITRMLSGALRNTAIDTRKSGLLVVDEDRHGAFTEYAASISETVPETFTVSTAKGRHFYFRQSERAHGNSPGALADWDCDVRGAGYVVAPGSVHETGVIYTAVNPGVPAAAMPGWLVTALQPAVKPAITKPAFQQPAPAPGRLHGIVAFVLDATKGNRNERLFWATTKAREMVAAGELDQRTAVRALTEAGESTGLGQGEVAATIDSGMRRPAR
jgi:hypothetical protein